MRQSLNTPTHPGGCHISGVNASRINAARTWLDRSLLSLALRPGRALHRLARASVLAGLVAITCLAAPAKAQTIRILVSNTAETPTSGTSNFILAQGFGTGFNPDGYSLSQIRIRLARVRARDTTTVRIHKNNSGNPGALVATLINPASFTADSLNTFSAPANTRYFVSVNEDVASSNRIDFSATDSDAEVSIIDASQSSWFIDNDRRFRTSGSGSWRTGSTALILEIRGTIRGLPLVSIAADVAAVTEGTAAALSTHG